jgi:hypothetical protein
VPAIWYYEENGAANGPLSREEIRDLVQTGTITRQTRMWTDSLQKWLPAEETTLENLFKTAPSASIPAPPPAMAEPAPPPIPAASIPGSGVPPLPVAAPVGFSSPRLLANILTALLIVLTVLTAMEIWSGLRQAELLERILQHGSFTREEALANDTRHSFIITTRLAVFCLTGIVFCCWIYLVAKNVRAMGARRLKFSPGWAVGYNFIPVVCWWLPYQAMKEIWKASVDPEHWRGIRTDPIVRWWWGLWIFSVVINYLLLRLTVMAGGHDPALATRMDIASCFVGIPRNIVAILLVQMLSALQAQTATTQR